MRVCKNCNAEKDNSEFYKSQNKVNGKVYSVFRRECKQCHLEKAKKRYRKQIDENGTASSKWVSLKNKYGLAKEEYKRMELDQNFKCLICGTSSKPYSLVVDHNHRTKEIRGLLCPGCNSGIGHLKDKPENLRKAYHYLLEKGHYG